MMTDNRSNSGEPTRLAELEPGAALLPERFDPAALLTIWCLRKAFFPLVWIGLIGAAIASRSGRIDAGSFDSFGEAAGAVLSPAAGVILALGFRVLAALVGFVLAARVTRSTESVRRPFGSGWSERISLLADELQVTRAYRSLRWTRAVRLEATARLGTTGQRFAAADRALARANVALLVALVAVVVVLSVA